MNIGIIIYSQSGNTNAVAEQLKEGLAASNHSVKIERLKPVEQGEKKNETVQLEVLPDLEQYDALIFGSPVYAFSLAPVMKNYLQQISSLGGKKVVCFVTKGLAFNWTGGNRAVREMAKICQSKKATVDGTGIVKWTASSREQDITALSTKIEGLFKQD